MSAVQKILLLEKNEMLRASVIEQLELNGEFSCVEDWNSDLALVLLAAENNEEADAACGSLRERGVKAPILLLGDAAGEGADDFLPKPFRIAHLLTTMRAQLRQHEKGEDGTRLGRMEFRPSEKSLIDDMGETIRLTEKETAILKYLLRAEEAGVGREELLSEVWGYNSGVTTHTLETHVYRLRRKLGQNDSGDEILMTEPGGYRLAR